VLILNSDNKNQLSSWLDTVHERQKESNLKFEEAQKAVEGLKYINTCPECKAVENTDMQIAPYSDQNTTYVCDICIEKKEKMVEVEEKRKADEKEKEEIKHRKIRYMIDIPPRYTDLNESTNEELINADCSIMYGGFGTGKTWESYSLIKYLYCNLKIDSYKLITEAGLINYLKAGFNNNSFEDRINSLKETDLLVVDEMGKSNDSDFNKAQLFEILNYRYDWMKKTVLICNCLEKSELVDILNPAITDRFRECIIEMKGQSKRYQNGN